MKDYLLKDLDNWLKRFLSKRRGLKLAIGSIFLLFIIYNLGAIFLGNWNVYTNFFQSCSSIKTEDELTIEWIKKNFTDTTYNVLLVPFNDYQESSEKRIKIEKALEQRFDALRNRYFYGSQINSSMRIKFYAEIPDFLSIDSIRNIGNQLNADLIIYGDIYDLFDKPSKRTNIKYISLQLFNKRYLYEIRGETGLIEFSSLDEIREGDIVKDIDYVTLWLYCNEELYKGNLKGAVLIWDTLEDNYKDSVFIESNSFLSANIGEQYFHVTELVEAKKFYFKSIAYYETGEIYSQIGLIYKSMGKIDSSKVLQLKAIRLSPYSPAVNNNLGRLYRILGNNDSAKYYYLNALKYDPKSFVAHNNLGNLYREVWNMYDSAEFHYKEAIKSDQTRDNAYYNMGLLYATNYKQYSYAITIFKYALKLNPFNPESSFLIGLIYHQELSIYDSAEVYYLKTIQLDSNYYQAHFNLGSLYAHKLNKPALAKKEFKKVLKIKPNFPEAITQLNALKVRETFK